jgi:hypothetical protein
VNSIQWAKLGLSLFRTIGPAIAGALVGAGLVPPEWAGFISSVFGGV